MDNFFTTLLANFDLLNKRELPLFQIWMFYNDIMTLLVSCHFSICKRK